jgi:hypothetical protein
MQLCSDTYRQRVSRLVATGANRANDVDGGLVAVSVGGPQAGRLGAELHGPAAGLAGGSGETHAMLGGC